MTTPKEVSRHRRVLIGLRPDDDAAAVLSAVHRLVDGDGAEVMLLRVLPSRFTLRMERAARARLAEIADRLGGTDAVAWEVRLGSFAGQVKEAARTLGADLVVLAERPRSWWRRLVFRDPAEVVAPIEAMTIHVGTELSRRPARKV